ncbi:hypothetical protein ACQPW3_40305 [Actinosynnema sp. CA-248983]
MTTATDLSDQDLLTRLADLLDRADPAPRTVVAQARAALAARTRAVLTRLITDSAHTGRARTARTLRFTALDVVLEPALNGLHVTGFAHTGTTLLVRWPTGERSTSIGPGGFFHVDNIPVGPLKFLLRQEDAPDTATRWFVV